MDAFSAWKISENDFPVDGNEVTKLRFLASYATLSPSTYNTQPWLFIVEGAGLGLYLDRRQGLAVIDPEDRQMVLGCASALYYMEVAAKYFGYKLEITLKSEEEGDEDLLARITLGVPHQPSEEEKLLFNVITKTHPNKKAFHKGPVANDDLVALKEVVAKQGAWLHICDSNEKNALTRMIIEADYIQGSKRNFRRELASWTDRRRLLSGDGTPQATLSTKRILTSMEPLAERRFTVEDDSVVSDEKMLDHMPVLAVLGSVTGALSNKIMAGRGFAALILEAELRGIAFSTLNQPCQLPETRLRMYDELGLQGRAHIILRLGYPKKKAEILPRRPIGSVVMSNVEEIAPVVPKKNMLDALVNFFTKKRS